ncbi:hypothetical protein MBLNU230_g1107t1 [Neophaeotheca triangularis]
MSSRLLSVCVSILALASRVVCDQGVIYNYTAYQGGEYGDSPFQTYKSDPVRSPLFDVTVWNDSLIDQTSHIIFEPNYMEDGEQRVGPYLFSSKDLSLVYGNPAFQNSNNARVQKYRGEDYLTYWAGHQGKGHATGNCFFMNNRYEVVYNISTVGLTTNVDLHECQITEDDTVLVTAYERTIFDLSPIGGLKEDALLDSVFQEIDIETGELLFSWRGSENIPVTDSYSDYERNEEIGWDAYHINSLQKNHFGHYLVSFRRLHSLHLINGTSGAAIWHLGGKHNNFRDLSSHRATDFAWQHHSRFIDANWTQLTVFDNRNLHWSDPVGCTDDRCSRGVRIKLNHDNMTAMVEQEFFAPQDIGAYAMGSYDQLANGNALLGWGSMASFSEYTAGGACVMDVQFGVLDSWVRTYRVYKSAWQGWPRWPPRAAADPHDRKLWVSWNGATEVISWAVLAHSRTEVLERFGPENNMHEEIVATVPKRGFETEIAVVWEERFVRLVALNEWQEVLGATGVVDTWTGHVKTAHTRLPDEGFLFRLIM